MNRLLRGASLDAASLEAVRCRVASGAVKNSTRSLCLRAFGVGVKALTLRETSRLGIPNQVSVIDNDKRDDDGSSCDHVCTSQWDLGGWPMQAGVSQPPLGKGTAIPFPKGGGECEKHTHRLLRGATHERVGGVGQQARAALKPAPLAGRPGRIELRQNRPGGRRRAREVTRPDEEAARRVRLRLLPVPLRCRSGTVQRTARRPPVAGASRRRRRSTRPCSGVPSR